MLLIHDHHYFCQTQPYQARVANADKNRAAHLTRVQHKASHNQDKALAAMSRRHMATGDASHFTVAATDDDDAVVQQQGWGYKPPMPARLQVRVANLYIGNGATKMFFSRQSIYRVFLFVLFFLEGFFVDV